MTTREQFIAWFETLTAEERIEVWYDCECMTRAEVDKLIAVVAIGPALKAWRPDSEFEVSFRWDLYPDRSTKQMTCCAPTLDAALAELFDEQGFSEEEKEQMLRRALYK